MLRRLAAALVLATLFVAGTASPALAVADEFASCMGGDGMPYAVAMTKSVTVQVRTATGDPVVGAAVVGRSDGGPSTGYRTTDASGGVRLECVSVFGYGGQDGASWSFIVSTPDAPSAQARVFLSTASPAHQTVVVRLRTPASVDLQVTAGGVPVTDTSVSLTEVSALPPGVLRASGGDGRLGDDGSATIGRLAAGTYEVRVGRARDFTGAVETRTVTLDDGANVAEIDFDGSRSLTVRVEVDGVPAVDTDPDDAERVVAGLRNAQGVAWNGSAFDDRFDRTATFTAPFLLDGEYTVTVAASGHGVQVFGPFSVSAAHPHRGVIVDLATGAVELQPIATSIAAELLLSTRADVLSEVVATVVSADPAVPPTGTVRFVSGDYEFGAARLNDDGVARLALPTSTPIGAHGIVAQYVGDGAHAGSAVESAGLFFEVRADETDGVDGTSFTTTVAAGGEVHFSTDGWFPGQPVAVTLYSDPAYLGTYAAGPDGVLAATVTIPAGTEPGSHHLQLRGFDWVRSLPIEVTAAPSVSTPPTPSPSSGSTAPPPTSRPTPAPSDSTPDGSEVPAVAPTAGATPHGPALPAVDESVVARATGSAPTVTVADAPSSGAAEASGHLAATGAAAVGPAVVGALLLAVGAVVVAARRARRVRAGSARR